MKKDKHKIILASAVVGFTVIALIVFFQQIIPIQNSVATPSQNLAQVPYVPLSGSELFGSGSEPNLTLFIQNIFKWGIVLAIVLAILFVILGAIQYMTTDAVFDKQEGKQKIMSALGGLILALVAWLILNEINPEILKINFDIN